MAIDALTLATADIEVTVLVDKGADILALVDRASGIDLLAKAPWGLRDPARAPGETSSFVAWLDRWSGGWQVLFPTGGGPCVHGGIELDYHGEAAIVPWTCERTGDAAATLEVMLAHSPFHLRRELRLDGRTLELRETVTNLGGDEEAFMWVHHPLFGPPLLGPGARLEASAGTVTADAERDGRCNPLQPGETGAWPQAVAKDGGTLDLSRLPGPDEPRALMAYLGDFTRGRLAVVNSHVGLELQWPAELLPYAWLFQEVHASPGYPWYRRAYLLGAEPASSVPGAGLARAIENGTALTLAPGAARTLELTATVLRPRRTAPA